jgi:predicted metal-dependent hydrolase
MSTEGAEMEVSGLRVRVVRKDIKNLHLGVYPPNGRVRVAAPLRVSDEAVRLAVIGKLGWIRKQQARFAAQPRQGAREMVSGESHYYLGRRYRLRVVEGDGPGRVVIRNRATLELRARAGSDAQERERILQRWHRERLRELVPPLLAKWAPVVGVQPAAWGIKKMKTRWGSCNPAAGRIWLNLELAKKPPQCLEYIIVHELTHLVERRHDDRFVARMDRQMPQWRQVRDELNREPLPHEMWDY